MLMKLPFLSLLLAPVAAKVFTGFNYGAFWSEQTNIKRYADFHYGFELAKNLTDTPVPFDSARLYTCITAGTKNDPTEAFQAAIDTGTNLLLGMWISPGTTGQPNDVFVDNELAALGKGFKQHGQKLADLVIGLSVGSEDVYRFNNQQVGVGSDNLLLTMESVREKIAAAPWAAYMKGKPIGHTDTTTYAVVPGSDFIGMTGYPFWEGQSIDNANATFMSILNDTQHRAGNTSIWISEVGWPIHGTTVKDAVASADNYQRYWDEVGCQVFGKYNTFWFELLQDSTPDQPDWGLLDTKTYKPRIRDLSCGLRNASTPADNHPSSSPKPHTSISSTVSSVSVSAPVSPTKTIHSTSTLTTSALQVTKEPLPATNLPLSVCIILTSPSKNSIYIPIAIHSNNTTCPPVPQFTGTPLTMIPESGTTVPYVPVTMTTSTAASTKPWVNGPTCIVKGGIGYEAVILDGRTYTGLSTSCSPSPSIAPPTRSAPPAASHTAPTTLTTITLPPSSRISAVPSPAPTQVDRYEGKIICLKHGIQAVIRGGVPHVIQPPVACVYSSSTAA